MRGGWSGPKGGWSRAGGGYGALQFDEPFIPDGVHRFSTSMLVILKSQLTLHSEFLPNDPGYFVLPTAVQAPV